MRNAWLGFGLVTLLGSLSTCGCSGPTGIVWPISGSTDPDWPLSSSFGPRLHPDGTYDFHRGIDIPVPVGTDVLAIEAGEVVRMEALSNGTLVQLRHTSRGSTYFSVYLHLKSASVTVGDRVEAGDVLGPSGVGTNGFAHLHFEIRDGASGQENCVHPLGFLPYNNATTPTLEVSSMDMTDPTQPAVTVRVTIPVHELDLNGVEVSLFDVSPAEPVQIDQKAFFFDEWNRVNTLAAPTGDELVDNPDLHDIHVAPEKFSAASDAYRIAFTFSKLAGIAATASLQAKARATDAHGKTVEVTYP